MNNFDPSNYGEVEGLIILKAIPKDKCLDDDIAYEFGDICGVIRVYLGQEKDADGETTLVTIKPTLDALTDWNVSKEELFNIACENNKAIFGFVLTDAPFLDDAYVILSKLFINGAAFVLDPSVREYVRKEVQDDYYICFLSVHEAVIHPKHTVDDVNALQEALNYMIESGATTSDVFLTAKVYEYSNGEFKMVSDS